MGIEPMPQEPKSCVLPLNYQPMYAVSRTSEHFHAWSLYAHRQPLFSTLIYLLSGNILRTLFIHVATDLVKHILIRLFILFPLLMENLPPTIKNGLKTILQARGKCIFQHALRTHSCHSQLYSFCFRHIRNA